jgi:hypothetical protein
MAQKKYNKPATPVKTTSAPVQSTAGSAALPKPGKSTLGKPAAKVETPVHFVFDKVNYQWLIGSIVMVAFGFFLMAGTTDIYSTTKIVVAPLVILAGFAVGFVAIFKKPAAKA